MGLGPAGIALYKELAAGGLMRPPMRVCDLGSQDVWEGSVSTGSARAWMEQRGYVYSCIDIDGRHGAWPLDLNVATAEGLGQFDIVTNHGTSEHVFDQANVFRLMHDLCAVGGLMVHMVPSPRYGPPHGFYCYDEVIFTHMAAGNGYKILKLTRVPDPGGELMLVVFRRRTDAAFVTPIQDMYAGQS